MADLFGRQDQVLNGGLSSDSMFVSWPELAAVGGGVGLLIQSIGLNYRQPVRRIFEIGPGVIPGGTSNTTGAFCDDPTLAALAGVDCSKRAQPTYYIIGRPEGRLQMSRFVGPNALTLCFYRKYGSPCSSNVMSLSGKAGCRVGDPNARRMTWLTNGVLLDGIDLNITAEEMVVRDGISAQFAGLNLTVEGDTGECTAGGLTGTSSYVNPGSGGTGI